LQAQVRRDASPSAGPVETFEADALHAVDVPRFTWPD
jgi:hypothetical protein